ncbi:hypothetical protein Scep_017816 [Stephania cephalantha]|uniref:Uncharacterized protein n=1 Tax=Stephania cephalantha TaxID=152367 RepID=A0AAP0NUL3_9MAGN
MAKILGGKETIHKVFPPWRRSHHSGECERSSILCEPRCQRIELGLSRSDKCGGINAVDPMRIRSRVRERVQYWEIYGEDFGAAFPLVLL